MKNNKYTPGQLKFLKINYKSMLIPELTKIFNTKFKTNKSEGAIHGVLTRYGFKSGRPRYFPKNHKPWNTGTKGIVKPNKGNFKKNNVPANHRPIGSERICSQSGCILVKIAEKDPHTKSKTRWKHKQIVNWEKKNGPVPDKMIVAFIDGDNKNREPENLMLISRYELLRLNKNKYKDTLKNIKPTVLALSKLEVKIFEIKRQKNGI